MKKLLIILAVLILAVAIGYAVTYSYGTTCDAVDVARSTLAVKVNEINAMNPQFMDIEVRAMTSNPVYTIVYCK